MLRTGQSREKIVYWLLRGGRGGQEEEGERISRGQLNGTEFLFVGIKKVQNGLG